MEILLQARYGETKQLEKVKRRLVARELKKLFYSSLLERLGWLRSIPPKQFVSAMHINLNLKNGKSKEE